MITLLKKISHKEENQIYLFGASDTGKQTSAFLSLAGVRYMGFLDNSMPEGGVIDGLKVFPLDVVQNGGSKDNIYVIITSHAEKAIRSQLLSYGVLHIISRRELALDYYAEYPVLKVPKPDHPTVSVLLTAYNEWRYTYNAVKSLLANENHCSFEIILGDNCSQDETARAEEYLEGAVVLHHKENLNYLGNVNEIAKAARGKYLFLLSNDTEFIQKGYLDKLVGAMEQDEAIGAVSGKLWIPVRNEYDYPGNYDECIMRNDVEADEEQNVEYLWPVAMLIRHNVWNEVGGLDPIFLPVYWEDSDLCLRIIKAGYTLRYLPYAEIVHYHGVSYGAAPSESEKKNRRIFADRWEHYLKNEKDFRDRYKSALCKK